MTNAIRRINGAMMILASFLAVGFTAVSNAATITVQSPKSGDTLVVGQPITIKWTSTGLTKGSHMVVVLLDTRAHGDTTASSVQIGQVLNSGQFKWTLFNWTPSVVGDMQIGGSACYKVAVVCTDGTPVVGYGGLFSITYSPNICFVAPNGVIDEQPEVWAPGSQQSATVKCDGTGRDGKLELKLVNLVTSVETFIGTTNVKLGLNTMSFQVPAAPLGHYRLAGTLLAKGTANAQMDLGGAFVVQEAVPGPITIVSPVAGDSLVNRQTTFVQWIGADPDPTDSLLQVSVASATTGLKVMDLGWTYPTSGAFEWTGGLPPGNYVVVLAGHSQFWPTSVTPENTFTIFTISP